MTTHVRYTTYTPEAMLTYLEGIYRSDYSGWKWEQGIVEGTECPWVSWESPDTKWFIYWQLGKDGHLTKMQYNPKQKVNLRVKE